MIGHDFRSPNKALHKYKQYNHDREAKADNRIILRQNLLRLCAVTHGKKSFEQESKRAANDDRQHESQQTESKHAR